MKSQSREHFRYSHLCQTSSIGIGIPPTGTEPADQLENRGGTCGDGMWDPISGFTSRWRTKISQIQYLLSSLPDTAVNVVVDRVHGPLCDQRGVIPSAFTVIKAVNQVGFEGSKIGGPTGVAETARGYKFKNWVPPFRFHKCVFGIEGRTKVGLSSQSPIEKAFKARGSSVLVFDEKLNHQNRSEKQS